MNLQIKITFSNLIQILNYRLLLVIYLEIQENDKYICFIIFSLKNNYNYFLKNININQ